MADATLRVEGLERAQGLFLKSSARLADPAPMMTEIGNDLVDSVQRNFEVGGRPADEVAPAETEHAQTEEGPEALD